MLQGADDRGFGRNSSWNLRSGLVVLSDYLEVPWSLDLWVQTQYCLTFLLVNIQDNLPKVKAVGLAELGKERVGRARGGQLDQHLFGLFVGYNRINCMSEKLLLHSDHHISLDILQMISRAKSDIKLSLIHI